ncbi:MAG: biotin transporter BioY [Terracidiphilus sp.]|jgi:biotin transport system substrate-specific component
MSNPLSAPLNQIAVSSARTPAWLRNTGIVLAGSAFVAACAHISIPLYFTPVPLTVQPFAVLLLGLMLSPRLALTTLVAYLAEGAAGLPVFTPTPAMAGLAHLFGPTGGYLLAYPLAAFLISTLWRQTGRTLTGRTFATAAFSAAAGDLAILLCGALWLAVETHASAQSVLMLAVLPFLAGDALKIIAAAALATGFRRLRPAHK